jgi:ABC-type multidrug transport system ATPase subunit
LNVDVNRSDTGEHVGGQAELRKAKEPEQLALFSEDERLQVRRESFSIEVEKVELVGVLGPNGVGEPTLLRAISPS